MASRQKKNYHQAKSISSILHAHSKEIYSEWLTAIKKKWRVGKYHPLLTQDCRKKNDPFSLVRYMLENQSEISSKRINPILLRLQSGKYSVSDFQQEMTLLENAVETVIVRPLQAEGAAIVDRIKPIREAIGNIVQRVLRSTADVYDHLIRDGARAYCQLNSKGIILYANEEMRRICGTQSVVGKKLSSFFKGDERSFIVRECSPLTAKRPQIRCLHLQSQTGEINRVDVEIASSTVDGQPGGGYAFLIDRSIPAGIETQMHEKSPLGVIKIKPSGEFTYANASALRICGLKSWSGKTIRNMAADDRNYQRMKKGLKSRQAGQSDEYEIDIRYGDGGKRIPIRVAAMPQMDTFGNVIGSIAIIKSVLLERTIENIHKHLTTIGETEEMLEAVAKETEKLLPFDAFTVILYSKDRKHLRSRFKYFPGQKIESDIRWYEISPELNDLHKARAVTNIDDVKDFVSHEPYKFLAKNPEMKKMIREGFHSMIRYPVAAANKVVAAVILLSKKKNAFRDDLESFKNLPLDKAVSMALYYDKTKELEFRLNLIQRIISTCENVTDVANVIAHQLLNHYPWDNVSIFSVREDEDKLVLLCQKATSPTQLFPEGFSLTLGKGILTRAYKTKEKVISGNVQEDPDMKNIYEKVFQNTKSELCLPVLVQGRVCWLLNIEDSRKNAFSREEIDSIQEIVGEIAIVLERVLLHHFMSTTLKSTSDIVIEVKINGKIRWGNPSAEMLLGYNQEELTGMDFKDLLVHQEEADLFLREAVATGKEMVFRHKNGESFHVLLSGSKLPEEFGGAVLIGKDLSFFNRIEELKHLGKMYYEIAIQTKTSLSLAFSWLKELMRKTGDELISQTLDKTLRQLHKVELTYDRLALYDKKGGLIPFNELLLNPLEITEKVLDEFPGSDAEKIAVTQPRSVPYIRGDLFQLFFCLETILSYLIRFAPVAKKVGLTLTADRDRVTLILAGFIPETPKDQVSGMESESQAARLLAEMALGEETIRAFIRNHRGEYCRESPQHGETKFIITLPAARED